MGTKTAIEGMRGLEVRDLLFLFLGGIGIFLFGMKFMSDGLTKIAGDRLRDLLDRFTSNPFKGVLVGIVVTVLLQSSTATIVLTVGLVNAGFMTLTQAIGVIMGANVGTTTTAFIIGINITDYALPIMFLGTFFIFFFKSKKLNNIGQVVFGFGALFLGLELMGDGVEPLKDNAFFAELTLSMSDNPILGVIVGTVFTAIIQSSTAAIGLLQSFYDSGAMSLDAALPVLFGDNIGTTITAVIASIGASVAAKRTALSHVIFNLIGATVVLILLQPFTALIVWFEATLDLSAPMTIAFAHGTYNVANLLMQVAFIGLLATVVTKLIPGKSEEIEYKAKHLDPTFIQRAPSIALGQAREETLRMANFAESGLDEVFEYLHTNNRKNAERTIRYEEAINNLDKTITEYLMQISNRSLSTEDSFTHTMLLDTVRDIERIGDHMENIMELVDYQIKNKVSLSDEAKHDLDEMFDLTRRTLQDAIYAMEHHDIDAAKATEKQEDEIDKMERKMRKKHILRMNEGRCSGSAGIVFVDIVSNLERIGDHSVNIAEAVLNEK
ncbi:Na/Pi cotransporter family protein [Geomicrobium sp. JCM 19039]|uniref:Na/Pi cotransporter family protein n=1 Tax=Geomicrobium sp. JCM 19039 TaxID=1460636 RepID=UPI00045F4892|nr:Na/Pi cotransporter family protein [Geomicrobium sp. JCM 19039]GAK11501.1 sodium-dependent phosphate transporter [Geomicrobium sp. JCM 19039]